ncbi:MAG: phosphodiester glycosidase family protein [Candidatus Viridilinea halotolerans]|uniref:Phosphodiester glycosidase family protein n=1 Tax=Candidatus Viridilinea halotolerans TaxID=2491704 RepID=A0A426TRV1_9CHLR|nr:MAG: phosphodiester glycosidase family protein [Candidatus Viridilinea halotolerans]
MPTPTGMPATTTTPLPQDSAWQTAAPGLELRRMRVPVAGLQAPVSLVRIDPQQVRFAVGYQPQAPLTLSQWASTHDAIAVINGGFFDASGVSVSLLIQQGVPYGTSYVERGGMFAVTPSGSVLLRALSDTPYDPREPLAEALQGWPLLVRTGGSAAYTHEDGQRARRSAIALDRSGRVLLIACHTSAFTLAELSHWLATADLDLDVAVNLDGGSSTGLLLRSSHTPERIEPFVPLPLVLLVLAR